MIEPDVDVELEDGEDLEDDLVFSTQLKDLIIPSMHNRFGVFILKSAREYAAHIAAKKGKDIKNLKAGSGTKKAHTAKPRNS